MRILSYIFLFTLLAYGCVSETYYKSGASRLEFEQAKFECEKELGMIEAEKEEDQKTHAKIKAKLDLNRCLQTKGWNQR